MAVNGIKNNKCFGVVLYPKFSGSGSVTVPANASAPRSITFSDANISVGDCALVTMQYDDSAIQAGKITITHAISDSTLAVFVANADSADHTITVNVVVV